VICILSFHVSKLTNSKFLFSDACLYKVSTGVIQNITLQLPPVAMMALFNGNIIHTQSVTCHLRIFPRITRSHLLAVFR
jgi:hypothetical protein